jgi:hypothetical protein
MLQASQGQAVYTFRGQQHRQQIVACIALGQHLDRHGRRKFRNKSNLPATARAAPVTTFGAPNLAFIGRRRGW